MHHASKDEYIVHFSPFHVPLVNYSRFESVDDIGAHDVDSLLIGTSLRNDEIGIALRRFDKLQMPGLEHIDIAIHHHLRRPSTLGHIAADDANEAVVGVGIDKDLKVHQVA